LPGLTSNTEASISALKTSEPSTVSEPTAYGSPSSTGIVMWARNFFFLSVSASGFLATNST
jgi:hypothetical protein